jgi:hypothetical protein
MNSIADGSVSIQTSSQSVLSTPCCFGEITLLARYLRKQGVLEAICEWVRFARRRDVCYEVIDFLAVQIALCRQLRTDARRLLREAPALGDPLHGPLRAKPPASALDAFALFGGAHPGARRSPAHADTFGSAGAPAGQGRAARRAVGSARHPPARLRRGWHGAQAARQRAEPVTPELPPAHRRLDEVCAPGYTGRKRGEVVRTRSTVLQAHSRKSAREFRQPRQWTLPAGTAPGSLRHRWLPLCTPAPPGTR